MIRIWALQFYYLLDLLGLSSMDRLSTLMEEICWSPLLVKRISFLPIYSHN